MQTILKLVSFGLICLIYIPVYAANPDYSIIVESQTPTTLNTIAKNAIAQNIAKLPIGEIMQWTALQMLGKPYVGGLLDKSLPEYLYISLEQTDCMLFTEEILALSNLIRLGQLNLANFTAMIKTERYHGEVAYCNRNHYFKDWSLVNQKKHLVIDEGLLLTGIVLPYPAHVLGDRIAKNPHDPHRADLSCIQEREFLINHEQLGFIPLKDLPKYLQDIQPGDIIGIVRIPKGRADSIHHLGIAYVHHSSGIVSMIDASSDAKQVVVAPSLMGYLAQFKDSQGIILLRAK